MSDKQKYWIGKITSLGVETVLIPANSRKEAIEKLKGNRVGVETISVDFGPEKSAIIIRQDKELFK